ncbi:MAG: helix-turn-helix domain-containing protein [bacterium]|nr:helix-turn-helix domain-containing protein [bacterium]
MKTESKILFKTTEAAAMLGFSVTTLHRHVKAGRLDCVRFSKNSVCFTRQQLDEFIERHSKHYGPKRPGNGLN